MATVICNYCQSKAKIVSGKTLYPYRPDLHHYRYWYCIPCDAYATAHTKHKDYKDQPILLANKELRTARMQAHGAFDIIWRSGQVTRSEAYAWLSKASGISPEQCHIGMMTSEQCRLTLKLCRSTTIEHVLKTL